MLERFQKNVLRQLFGILLIADDAGNQGKYLLTVLIQEVFDRCCRGAGLWRI